MKRFAGLVLYCFAQWVLYKTLRLGGGWLYAPYNWCMLASSDLRKGTTYLQQNREQMKTLRAKGRAVRRPRMRVRE